MKIRGLFLTLLFALFLAPAMAQSPPFSYPQTIGTSSVQILAPNQSRKKLIFHNPNATALVAVCPVGPNRTAQSSQSLIVAVINGAGCVTILPYDRWEVTGSATGGQQGAISTAWVGIASAGGSALSIFELE